ncbi:MAG: hypothetical protein ACJ741_07300 [Pyrinomonadaceae bacterium]
MQKNPQVRIVKREQRATLEREQRTHLERHVEARGAQSGAPSERELKAVVAGWVREHRERAEDCRRSLAAVFAGGDFSHARSA